MKFSSKSSNLPTTADLNVMEQPCCAHEVGKRCLACTKQMHLAPYQTQWTGGLDHSVVGTYLCNLLHIEFRFNSNQNCVPAGISCWPRSKSPLNSYKSDVQSSSEIELFHTSTSTNNGMNCVAQCTIHWKRIMTQWKKNHNKVIKVP
jgi:hypothetical protein